MRSLNRNKTPIWVVSVTGKTKVVDGNGNSTGEYQSEFSTPRKIEICIMPNNGSIIRDFKGEMSNSDMLATDMNNELKSDDLLFLEEPSTNFDRTFDYYVKSIKRSLNHSLYILAVRK